MTNPRELRPGDIVAGRYQLLEPLGTGGMGRVWAATNLTTGATVAAKVLLPAHAASPESISRFRREAEVTAKLSHRAVVRVFDLVELEPDSGSFVIVMELLRGHTLANRLEHMGRLGVEATLQMAFPLLSALEHAHALGVVHRDLKPENVFLALEPDGQQMPKIVDFGISKQLRESPITLDGQILGTLSYMSPEQTMGTAVDARSDVFAFGILLYECLSGETPFQRRLTGAGPEPCLMSAFDLQPRVLADIPAPLWEVIRRALAVRAQDRFESATALAEALRIAAPRHAAFDPRASNAPDPPRATPVRATLPPRLSRRLMAAAIFAAVGAMTVASAAHPSRARATRDEGSSALLVHRKHMTARLDLLRGAPAYVDASGAASRPLYAEAAQRAARPTAVFSPPREGPVRLVRDPGF